MFQPDEWQQKSLLTWYAKDNPLHLNPRHPCIKLAGESGEILDLYGKEEYKPNFSWWDCKHCGWGKDNHGVDLFCGMDDNPLAQHTPLILDELGDYSYYLRILAYQQNKSFIQLCNENSAKSLIGADLFYWLAALNSVSAKVLQEYEYHGIFELNDLYDCIFRFLAILDKLNTPLSQVLELNYKKLNSEETNHGWKSATIKK